MILFKINGMAAGGCSACGDSEHALLHFRCNLTKPEFELLTLCHPCAEMRLLGERVEPKAIAVEKPAKVKKSRAKKIVDTDWPSDVADMGGSAMTPEESAAMVADMNARRASRTSNA